MVCTCGNQVASNSRFCPRCGKRFTRKSVKLLAWFFAIAIGFGIVIAAVNPSNPTTPASAAEQQKKAQDEAQFQAGVEAAKRLMNAMRNPDSFKLSSALFMPDGAVCYEYRAQNGFGGMNVGNAVLSVRGAIKTNEMEGYRKLWNLECANKSGYNKTWEVNYAIGKERLLR
jgi:hypothetical protein